MVMDGNSEGYCGLNYGIKPKNDTVPVSTNQKLANRNLVDVSSLSLELNPEGLSPYPGDGSNEDCDFSDMILKYISEMLMEEDIEDKVCTFNEAVALQAKEKSFYEALGEKYPVQDAELISNLNKNSERPLEYQDENYDNCRSIENMNRGGPCCSDCKGESRENESEAPNFHSLPIDAALQSRSPSISSSYCSGNVVDGPVDSPVSTLIVSDIFINSQSIIQFKKGVEEASKFLPDGNNLFVDFSNSGCLVRKSEDDTSGFVKEEVQQDSNCLPDETRGRKNPLSIDLMSGEGRSNKQSAVYVDSTVRSEMFDMVLLCSEGNADSALRELLKKQINQTLQDTGQSKGSRGGKTRGKIRGSKKHVADLRTLLTLCAQAVAADDRRTANEFLKQIRQHSSPTGDGMQRLGHYFADGLEARMAGSGTKIYTDLISMPTSAADVLKAYHLYVAACPFRKMSNFFSNRTIMKVAEDAPSLHIIDFGILYGFQWPCLIQRLSSRPGGPPKLRITGIDFPHPGFRPSERVEETGCRLANYAETFKVPFEFKAIAQKWETIQLGDLNINKNEVLVVNCLYRFRNLLDETVMVNSPRNIVVNLIRKMNPAVYIQGIVNGAYNAPFFVTRFREALFHYSSLFDMLEVNIPREIHERMLIEKTIFGREAMNVIACEAAERIERPETYKQWQIRNLRAGFRQLPLNEEIVNMAKDWVKSSYHKDFMIDENGHWLLQGWKGRIIYALCSWSPAY